MALLFAVAACGVAAQASAQGTTKPAAAAPSEAPEEVVIVLPAKTTRLDFSEVNVGGTLVRPDGSYLVGRPKPHFRNLIELRSNFRPEFSRSTSALRTNGR